MGQIEPNLRRFHQLHANPHHVDEIDRQVRAVDLV
jgi:hypothetical protein